MTVSIGRRPGWVRSSAVVGRVGAASGASDSHALKQICLHVLKFIRSGSTAIAQVRPHLFVLRTYQISVSTTLREAIPLQQAVRSAGRASVAEGMSVAIVWAKRRVNKWMPRPVIKPSCTLACACCFCFRRRLRRRESPFVLVDVSRVFFAFNHFVIVANNHKKNTSHDGNKKGDL